VVEHHQPAKRHLSQHGYKAAATASFRIAWIEGDTMNRKQMIAANALLVLFGAVASGAQTTTQTTRPVPITSQTPLTDQNTTTTTTTLTPLTKSEMKAQRKQQKHEERAAKANSKAAKDQADAIKQRNKSVQESEKATVPQS